MAIFKSIFRIIITDYNPTDKTYDESSQVKYYLFGILIYHKDYEKLEKVTKNDKIGFTK